MGITSVLMASPLVNGVSVIVAKHKHFPSWSVKLVLLMAKIFGKFDCSETTIEAVKKTNIPILFVHGKDDKFVPFILLVPSKNKLFL